MAEGAMKAPQAGFSANVFFKFLHPRNSM